MTRRHDEPTDPLSSAKLLLSLLAIIAIILSELWAIASWDSNTYQASIYRVITAPISVWFFCRLCGLNLRRTWAAIQALLRR